MGEIQAIIRQITASVTFLPMLEDKCTFDLLVYTKADSAVPQQWCVSSPSPTAGWLARRITNALTTSVRHIILAVDGRRFLLHGRKQCLGLDEFSPITHS